MDVIFFGVDSQMKTWRVEFGGSPKDVLITDRVISVGTHEFKIPRFLSARLAFSQFEKE